MPRIKTEDIGDIISESGFEKLKKGQVLTFNLAGMLKDYKIIKIYKDEEGQHVIVKNTRLYDPSEIKFIEKKK